jgi:hypothetical protein
MWTPATAMSNGDADRLLDRARAAILAAMRALQRHARVVAIAAAFGLGAYAVVSVLVWASRRSGLLAWLAG